MLHPHQHLKLSDTLAFANLRCRMVSVKQEKVYHLPIPGPGRGGRASNSMVDSRGHESANHQKWKSKYADPSYRGIGVTKKNTAQSSMNGMFLLSEKTTD